MQKITDIKEFTYRRNKKKNFERNIKYGLYHLTDQMNAIKVIEENLEKFTSKSKKEATEFISENNSDYYKQLLLSNYGGYKEIWKLLNNNS